ncbi:hypothetical protein GCM10023115_02590 [Pontixanthobacter gangjinensis]|uniref:Phage tail assembly chaperone n=1 Tax=Pontixanthobacter gangjinensis TaxID=1028742 RepID=A0A6I4SL42_9SPHN|nr:phage tail assembly chaperone [Pontixanthobacter gangjinensis]MXO55512.1 phage tail assembly chaperone [Pontixanthobacter gangjinensis]
MNQCFGESAIRLAGLAAQVLGWRPGDFWNATPADLVLSLNASDTETDTLTRTELNSLLEGEQHG